MTKIVSWALLVPLALAGGGCATGRSSNLPAGQAAYAAIPVKALADVEDEVLRPGDRLAIRVLGEPELTSDLYRVDGNGYVQVPLAGEMLAAGLKPGDFRDELTRRLAARFIRDPQVAVIVTERRRTTFAVEGDVREPGIFEAAPNTSLLTAIAQAKSPTDVAKLDEVMIFRMVNNQRMGARFNLTDIRRGAAPDPQVIAGDTVVVGHSALKDAWQQFLKATPLFNLFYIFR